MDLTQRARALLPESDGIAEHLVEYVWQRLPGYEASSLDRSEVSASIRSTVRSLLTAVAEHRRPRDDELTPARSMGERRAVQGVPIESLVGSWHNAERVILERLLTSGETLAALDVRAATGRLGVAIDAMIEASTTAYRDVGNEIYAHVSQIGVDIVSQLAGAEPLDPIEVDRRAGMVGVETHLPHRALAISVQEPDGVLLARARRAVIDHIQPHVVGRVMAGSHQGFTLLLFADNPNVVAAVTRATQGSDLRDSAYVGLGEARPRLNEAAGSCHEAISAAKVGLLVGQRVTRYELVIPEVLITENPLASQRMVTAILGALEHPESVQTLRVFLASRLSIRATARALELHENTVAYRIRRITDQLGVTSPAELVRPDILLALRAQEVQQRSETDA